MGDSSSDEDKPLAFYKDSAKKDGGGVNGETPKRKASNGKSKAVKQEDKEETEDEFEEKPTKKAKVAATANGSSNKKKLAKASPKIKAKKEKSESEESDDEKGSGGEGSDSSSQEDDDFEKAPKQKRAKVEAKVTVKKEEKPQTPQKKAGAKKKKNFGDTSRAERLDNAMKAYKWWEEPALEPGRQWNSLEHNGMFFADEYVPHKVPFRYDGQIVELSPEDEEMASFYADVPLDGPQLTGETADVFQKNFMADWKESLPTGHPLAKAKFSKCDFTAIREHLTTQRLVKKAATDEEKAEAKAIKESRLQAHGFAVVDGHLEKVGNFTMEPPGLFRGRGKHPKTGKIKKRTFPSQVTVNVGETAKVPQCPVPGFAWANVSHDPAVAWLSSWKENVLGSYKYVMLAASSSFKGKSDMGKYNKAMKLKGFIEHIRGDYETNLIHSVKQNRQLATAMWLIDKLALRVGGEKDADEEADTVGCCTLRVEHITFNPEGAGEGERLIELKFLGKDSMQFKQVVDFDDYGEVGKRVYANLKAFCKTKRPSEQVFQEIDPSILNKHLTSLMPGLSAKVFRTYNASETLQNELPTTEELEGLTASEKVLRYNDANREVAILCNHQRTVSNAMQKNFDASKEKMQTLVAQKDEMKKWVQYIKENKSEKIRIKGGGKVKSEGKETEDAESMDKRAKEALEKAKAMKAAAKTSDEKVKATNATEEANKLRKEAASLKHQQGHLFASEPTEDQVGKRITAWTAKIKKAEIALQDKEQNKEVSLGTSKINYMDPRISVAWCKRNEVPIEKIFAKTLRDKFVWALAAPPDWRFDFETLGGTEGPPPPPTAHKRVSSTREAAEKEKESKTKKAKPTAAAAAKEEEKKETEEKNEPAGEADGDDDSSDDSEDEDESSSEEEEEEEDD